MKVLLCGSFNPFHNGHAYVYNLACKMFGKDNVWLGVGTNKDKDSVSASHIKRSLVPVTRNVICYSGLTSDIVKDLHFDLLVRGVRPSFSLEDEFQLMTWNRKLCDVDTILIPTHEGLSSVSSSALRLLHENNKNIGNYMDLDVLGRWSTRITYDNEIKVFFGKCCSGKSTYLNSICDTVGNVDKILFDYIDCPAATRTIAKKKLKKLFYVKDMDFITECCKYYAKVDWESLFSSYSVFDMPNIGTAWNFIPQRFRDRMTLVKVSTDDKNRVAFSKARGANPKLIECSDHFYIEPKFWDEDVVIKAQKRTK